MSEQTVGERLEKKQQRVTEEKCNICSCPREIEFQEKDEESGKIQTKTHTVECGGHMNIPPYLWNKHPQFDKFKVFEVRHKQACSKPSKKLNK